MSRTGKDAKRCTFVEPAEGAVSLFQLLTSSPTRAKNTVKRRRHTHCCCPPTRFCRSLYYSSFSPPVFLGEKKYEKEEEKASQKSSKTYITTDRGSSLFLLPTSRSAPHLLSFRLHLPSDRERQCFASPLQRSL